MSHDFMGLIVIVSTQRREMMNGTGTQGAAVETASIEERGGHPVGYTR